MNSRHPRPWRRFFARTLDTYLYSTILYFIYYTVLNQKLDLPILVALLIQMGTMILIEPVFIFKIGTTPGKWLLGISVARKEGGRLTYGDAFWRTLAVLWYGEALYIPYVCLWRNYRSCRMVENGKALPWEETSICQVKKYRAMYVLKYILCYGVCVFIMTLNLRAKELPVNRGEITVSEFAENYNTYRKQAGLMDETGVYSLDVDGQWYGGDENVPVLRLFDGLPMPEYHYTEKDGIMTGVSFEVNYKGSDWIDGYVNEIPLMVCSYLGASGEYTVWNGRMEALESYLEDNRMKSFELETGGISINCQMEWDGLAAVGNDLLMPLDEEEDGSFHIFFEMKR